MGLVLDRGTLPEWLHTGAIGPGLKGGAVQGVVEEGGGGRQAAGQRFHRSVHLWEHHIMPTQKTTESTFQILK